MFISVTWLFHFPILLFFLHIVLLSAFPHFVSTGWVESSWCGGCLCVCVFQGSVWSLYLILLWLILIFLFVKHFVCENCSINQAWLINRVWYLWVLCCENKARHILAACACKSEFREFKTLPYMKPLFKPICSKIAENYQLLQPYKIKSYSYALRPW